MQQLKSVTDYPVEVRELEGKPTISGYAAVFDSLSEDLGGYREIIRRGAFDDTLQEIRDGKRTVAARIQHEGGLSTIGTTSNASLRLNVDAKGLKYDITPPDTTAGRDIVALVQGGYINKSSFAFSLRSGGERWNTRSSPPERELLKVNLHDVAPVDGPAYEATSVQARSLALASLQAVQAESRGNKSGIEVRERENGGKRVELYFLDEIMPTWIARYMTDAMGAGDVIDALKEAGEVDGIDVFINSPGGDVFEAMTIYNTLKDHPAPVNVYVRGLAASAAGIIAMAGNTIHMGEGSMLMVHNAWTAAGGNAEQMRTAAVLLDKIDGEIAGILSRRSKNELADVQKWMNAETWFTAGDAVANGFADRASGVAEVALTEADGERCRRFDYRNIPKSLGGPGPIETRMVATNEDFRAMIDAALKKAI